VTKAAPTAAGAARVLGQVATGAAFAIFFGLAGAATATAKERQQPPGGGGSACKAKTGGDCTPMGGDKGDSNEGRNDEGSKVRGHVELRQAKPQKQTRKPTARTPNRPRSRDDDDRDRDKDDDKPEKDRPEKDKDKDKPDKDKPDKDKDKPDKGKGKDKDDDEDEDEPDKDRGERSGGDRRHDYDDDGDDDGGKSEKDRHDDKPEKPEKNRDDDDKPEEDRIGDRPSRAERPSNTQVSRVRPASVTSVPTARPVSLTTSSSNGGIPWGDDNGFAPPGCSDDDGCDQAFNYLDWVTRAFQGPAKAIQDAFTPDDNGFDIQGPDGKGKIFSIEGHSYYAQGKWSTPDGKIEGEYSVGVDGKIELKLEKMVLPKFEASALLGARVTGPEVEAPMGPLLTKLQPEISAGIGAEFGAGFERGEDGKYRLQGKGGVTGPVGGSTGFEVSPKDDPLRELWPK
jgi:hypothetical protein